VKTEEKNGIMQRAIPLLFWRKGGKTKNLQPNVAGWPEIQTRFDPNSDDFESKYYQHLKPL